MHEKLECKWDEGQTKKDFGGKNNKTFLPPLLQRTTLWKTMWLDGQLLNIYLQIGYNNNQIFHFSFKTNSKQSFVADIQV